MSEINSRTSPRRILNILEEILLDPDNFTAKKISHKLGIPLATVYRHIETLCDERFLIADNSKKYIPGPKIRNIILHSLPYEPNFTLRRSYLRKLTEEIKETVSLSVPIGTKLVYFDRIEFHWPMQLNLEAGDHLPLHASASGKLYLSSIKKVDALEIFKKPIIELHISNIYKREEFRQKSLISDVVTGVICGLGIDGYILAINAIQKLIENENR